MATIPVNFRIEEESDQKLAALAAASVTCGRTITPALMAKLFSISNPFILLNSNATGQACVCARQPGRGPLY